MEEVAAAVYAFIMGLWAIWQGGNLERSQRRRLIKMLNNPKWKWRSLSWLSASIAADREATKRLLVQLKAKPRPKNAKYWGLESRVGTD